MKAITDTSKLPKFLVCNNVPEKNWFWNDSISLPWRSGEIVKVREPEFQRPNPDYKSKFSDIKPYTDNEFRMSFVRVMRKDKDGKFTLPWTGEWSQFELLKNIKTIK